MQLETWTRWPSREALGKEERSRPGQVLSFAGRLALLLTVLLGTVSSRKFTGGAAVVAILILVASVLLFLLLFRATRNHRIGWALAAAGQLVVLAPIAHQIGAETLANLIWCALSVIALIRLPLVAAVPTFGAAVISYSVESGDSYLALVATVVGLALLGYLIRLDSEARGTALRLQQQERAIRVAEAESAALAERARIAREIHDVLAHSLSAQLVHLEAARLMLDGGAEREQVRERVVAARRMAQEGLIETRQALSALRGEFTTVGEFLVELTNREHIPLTVTGTPRPLAAEVGLAVRRTAQEALTNVRKHAPRARCAVELRYLAEEVELEIRNTVAPATPVSAELAGTGSGYGLLGMRERAELLGGSLQAGSDEDGWLVRLRLPV
ncbi:two-component sensor histidine kinase [Streptomyces tateyamensis]|uniref:histidine kinase n=1 Tax=Streptomyces tateyamensis TaxID=565073 RepID=A0A2V4NKP9_9ACTN|nr:histidine kinase [Streptomyces tateyamensis]PYC86153.1 two-component sensor histidine kinase [Streptomyces tateyamensis]